jgi:hypothetical protein
MKHFLRALLLAGLASVAQSTWSLDLSGKWTLKIEDLDHKVVATMTVRFKEGAAPSCLGGSWRQLAVESSKTTDPSFFPISDPLSYSIAQDTLLVGRNELCDAYRHLTGKLDKLPIRGEYSSFGWSRNHLGYFSLDRAQ